jgi:hypothetical protein
MYEGKCYKSLCDIGDAEKAIQLEDILSRSPSTVLGMEDGPAIVEELDGLREHTTIVENDHHYEKSRADRLEAEVKRLTGLAEKIIPDVRENFKKRMGHSFNTGDLVVLERIIKAALEGGE